MSYQFEVKEEILTYPERSLALQNIAILVVNSDLQLLHARGAASEQRREHLGELVADRQLAALERNFSVLDVSDASGGAGDELVAQLLQLREGPMRNDEQVSDARVASAESLTCHRRGQLQPFVRVG